MGQAVDNEVVLLAREFDDLLKGLKDDFVGRDETIEVIALATLCREHVLLIGPPGTAKTALLNRFAQLFGTTDEKALTFTYLLTRFTEPTELFGPVDITQFQQGRYRVKTDGMLPRVPLAFLDEVFEGSSAILNSLLTLINERVFYNGSQPEPSELITLLGSSNQIPEDPVLAAFSDRFLLRTELSYVADDELGRVLHNGWAGEQQLIRAAGEGRSLVAPSMDASFTLAKLAVLQDAVAKVDLSPITASYLEVLRSLRRDKIAFSDRRAVKAQKVFAASAVLDGRRAADPTDLGMLAYLWTERRDQDTIRRALEVKGIEITRRDRVRQPVEIMHALQELLNNRRAVRTMQDLWEVSNGISTLRRELRQDHPTAVTEFKRVDEEREATARLIDERRRQEDGDV
ncbi:MAG: AAA family ATPase [Pseudonocardiales bacterium]|nr:AAA family ATPase [Pseudonocardiales bacterium]